MAAAASLDDYRFSIVDVETTGLFPRAHDRIIEIAIIGLDPQGSVIDEFVTLINPERDLGPTHIHGILAGEVLDAPKFADIAGDVACRLAGNVIVAHNAHFDLDFFDAEFNRIGHPLRSVPPTLCTLKLAHRLVPSTPSYRLGALCELFKIHLGQAHSALDDARALARLLAVLLSNARSKRWNVLDEFGCTTPSECVDAWPHLTPSGRAHTRQHAKEKTAKSYLARLVERLPATDALSSTEALEYVDLLNRVLEDRRVTSEEANLLLEVATRWGLTAAQAQSIHGDYLRTLVEVALQDGIITEVERRDLNEVAQLLGCDADTVATLIASAQQEGPINRSAVGGSDLQRNSLSGLSVCFTGESRLTLNGAVLSRSLAEQMATQAGLIVRNSVTKGLNILVVADPDSLSGKARKARDYGTRIIAEMAFWQLVGIDNLR